VIAGMLAASVIAIFFVPVTFHVVERFATRKHAGTQPPQPAAQPGTTRHARADRGAAIMTDSGYAVRFLFVGVITTDVLLDAISRSKPPTKLDRSKLEQVKPPNDRSDSLF
jgi:hypothetical protein